MVYDNRQEKNTTKKFLNYLSLYMEENFVINDLILNLRYMGKT